MSGKSLNVKFLVLMLTGKCNLRCRYCYVNADSNGTDISRDTALKAVNVFALDNELIIELAGGEPFLRFGLIRDIVEYTNSLNPSARFAVQTNGTLMDEEKLHFLKQHRVGLGVSIDGVPSVNEALRGKTKELVRGLKSLSKFGLGANITTVLTRENTDAIPQFLLFCANFSCVRTINLDIIRPFGRAADKKLVPEKSQITNMVDGMFDSLAFINSRRFPPLKVREIEQVYSRLDDEIAQPYCYADSGLAAAVSPDGKVYPCASLVGMEEYQAGTVWEFESSKLKKITCYPVYPDECRDCDVRSICRSGCPSRRIAFKGNLLEICEIECHLRREIYRRVQESWKN
jgi:uncharacterized protein